MALRSNASTTSLMNDARSPSGNHSRMSGGNNNRWSCEYGRKRWLMSHTLLARAPLTQHFQSDRLLARLEDRLALLGERLGPFDRVLRPAQRAGEERFESEPVGERHRRPAHDRLLRRAYRERAQLADGLCPLSSCRHQ